MKFYQSSLLNHFSNLRALFTTSQSKNLAFHVGDSYQDVLKHHKILASELEFEYKELIYMKQIHSSIVHKVSTSDTFYTPPSCDALITNRKNTPLMVMVADCTPLLLYDKRERVIAVVHAGREGAFKNIVAATLKRFRDDFHSNAEDIYVSLGPAICTQCYEVSSAIASSAIDLGYEFAIKSSKSEHYLDIEKILLSQLLAEGIKKEHIERSELCNSCATQEFYSHRRGDRGRFAGVMILQ